MPRQDPPCPLCGRPIPADWCGPIAGGHAWIRKGERTPSPPGDADEGDWLYVCDACLKTPEA